MRYATVVIEIKNNARVARDVSQQMRQRKMMPRRVLRSFYSVKDSTLSLVALKTLRFYLKEYAKMLDFKLDSQKKTIVLNILPKGEKESIAVELTGYEIVNKDEKVFLKFTAITTSREWMNLLIEHFGERLDEAIEIPREYAKLLGILI